MKPISFKEQNVVFADHQSEYLPLPAHRDVGGEVVSCWRLSLYERVKLLFTGKLWLRVLTFGMPLEPQLLEVDNPFAGDHHANPT